MPPIDDRLTEDLEQPVPELEEDDAVIEGDPGYDEEEFGDFDGMFDPVQALGQLLVTADNESIADILADIRTSLDKGVKILYKMASSPKSK